MMEGNYVGEVMDAIITKFKLNVKPQQVVLMLDGDASRTALDPTHTLLEANIRARTKLRVAIKPAAMPAAQTGE